jgi:mannose-6-phosphate isomerase-like protein (cupin superfamily)
MRNTRHVPRKTIAASLLLIISTVCLAQTKHLAPHATVPRQTAPPEALDDCCFRKLFANEHVRVLRLQIAPHQSTSINRRAHDYLILPLEYAYMETAGQQGNTFEFEMRLGQMQVIKGGWPHRTTNKANTPLDVLEFEITRGIKPDSAICGLSGKDCADGAFGKDENGTYEVATIFETPTVRLKKVELGPGGSLAGHHHVGGDLLIASTSFDLLNDTGGATSTIHLDSGQVQWLAPGAEHTLRNQSKETAKFFELEVK